MVVYLGMSLCATELGYVPGMCRCMRTRCAASADDSLMIAPGRDDRTSQCHAVNAALERLGISGLWKHAELAHEGCRVEVDGLLAE